MATVRSRQCDTATSFKAIEAVETFFCTKAHFRMPAVINLDHDSPSSGEEWYTIICSNAQWSVPQDHSRSTGMVLKNFKANEAVALVIVLCRTDFTSGEENAWL